MESVYSKKWNPYFFLTVLRDTHVILGWKNTFWQFFSHISAVRQNGAVLMNMQILTPYVISSSGRSSCHVMSTAQRTARRLLYWFCWMSMSRRLFPLLWKWRTASSTFYEVDKECVDSPSGAPLHQTPIMTRLLLEIWKKNKTRETQLSWLWRRQAVACDRGPRPRGRAASVRTPASKPSSSGIGPACWTGWSTYMARNLWYVSILYSNLICCIMLTINHKIIPCLAAYVPSMTDVWRLSLL